MMMSRFHVPFVIAFGAIFTSPAYAALLDLQKGFLDPEESESGVNNIGGAGLQGESIIDVVLTNGTQKTFSMKTTATSQFLSDCWGGEAEVDGSALNMVRLTNGVMAGSLVNMETAEVNQFRIDADGNIFNTVTDSADFPPEGDPEFDEDDEHDDDHGTRDLLAQGLNHFDPEGLSMKTSISHNHEEDAVPNVRRTDSQGRMLGDDLGGNLDVMIVWTKNAECRVSGFERGCKLNNKTYNNMMAHCELAVAETNTAYQLSGVKTELLLVHAYREKNYEEKKGEAFGHALSNLRGTDDGIMDNVHSKRTKYGADIVAMFIDSGELCGLANIGPKITRMFSVSFWKCATGNYTFGHEVGHNQGCLHDKGTSDACDSKDYNYGYRDTKGEWRTILAYGCKTNQCDKNPSDKCPKIQRFSNPKKKFDGRHMGSATIDNRRQINDVRAAIAAYYPHKGTTEPTPAPTDAPITDSTPSPSTSSTPPPSSSSTPPPTEAPIACIDSPSKFIFKGEKRTCKWAKKNAKCDGNKGIQRHCPKKCDKCEENKCANSPFTFILGNGTETTCKVVKGLPDNEKEKMCKNRKVKKTCRSTCGYCE